MTTPVERGGTKDDKRAAAATEENVPSPEQLTTKDDGNEPIRRSAAAAAAAAAAAQINPSWCSKTRMRFWHKTIALSVYSMAGESLRILTENLFGIACQKPGTVGWNVSEWTPCTTAPGTTSATGGAFFSDLPANMLGCFVMGLVVSGHDHDRTTTTLQQLPVHAINVACLPRTNWFQSWDVTHLALRTAFCGSLTTFSSWNAQMVVMICAGEGTALGTQWVSALFGYCIGWMMALQSFYVGRHMALLLHRWCNPDLAREADVLKERRRNVIVNRALPDLERRYLYDLMVAAANEDSPPENDEYESRNGFHHLQRWKQGTHRHRYELIDDNDNEGGGSSFLQELHEIERLILLEERDPRDELLQVAINAGWDVDALQQWKRMSRSRHCNEDHVGSTQSMTAVTTPTTMTTSLPVRAEYVLNAVALCVAIGLLIWGVVSQSGSDAVSLNYRTSFLGTLLAPLGTLLRWRLSRWNNHKGRHQQWFPMGTFVANMLACSISSLMSALVLHLDESGTSSSDNSTTKVWLNALKTGFAGSLSTVSTFTVELAALLQSLPQNARGYYYLLLSLTMGCIFGVVFYVWAVV